jgi:hypothetical protein
MISIPGFIRLVQCSKVGRESTHRQQGDLISLLLFSRTRKSSKKSLHTDMQINLGESGQESAPCGPRVLGVKPVYENQKSKRIQ